MHLDAPPALFGLCLQGSFHALSCVEHWLVISAASAPCRPPPQAEYNRVSLSVNEQGEIVAPPQGNVGILGLQAVSAWACEA